VEPLHLLRPPCGSGRHRDPAPTLAYPRRDRRAVPSDAEGGAVRRFVGKYFLEIGVVILVLLMMAFIS
jgi:hypothetical protein